MKKVKVKVKQPGLYASCVPSEPHVFLKEGVCEVSENVAVGIIESGLGSYTKAKAEEEKPEKETPIKIDKDFESQAQDLIDGKEV
jgi:hypothetical protein